MSETAIEHKIAETLVIKRLRIATTESCTGGLLSSRLTDVSGSSSFIHLNLVTYSNEAKQKMLGVRKETLDNYGAVSEECAYEMAKGLYNLTKADVCISTTGIAGPTGGTKEKPVGLMFSTIYTDKKSITFETLLPSNTQREKMKYLFTQSVLERLNKFLNEQN